MIKETTPVKFKKCALADLDKLVWISRKTYYDTFIVSNSAENMEIYLNTCMSIEVLGKELQNENSIFYLTFVDDELMGYLKINIGPAQTETFEQSTIELERIYILKKFQGNKYGDILLQKAIDHAKEINAEYLWLGVWESNFRAIRFYEKKGFVKFTQHNFVMGNDVQIDQLMKLNLR